MINITMECFKRFLLFHMSIRKVLFPFFLLIFSQPLYAVDAYLNWKTTESENFIIHYADGYRKLAQKAANAAETAHTKLQPLINWQPLQKTHLVISDETDQPNGFAIPIHFNRSVLFVAPPDSANTLEDFDDWLETLITHEYTHILHLDKARGPAGKLRNIFGRHFLLFPNIYQPTWLIEGLATYHETDDHKGIGRGQSSLYRMMMRVEVENGVKPVGQVNLPVRSWPMGAIPYLYGVNFYQFIEEVYGQKGIDALVNNYSNNIIPFMINTNARQTFNKDIEQLWQEFSIWLEKKYIQEINEISDAKQVSGERVTNFTYSTRSLVMDSQGKVYYVAQSPYEHEAVYAIDNEQHKKISDIHRGASINVIDEDRLMVNQLEYCNEYNLNTDIYTLDVVAEDVQRITECGRYRSAVALPNSKKIIAVKLVKGKSELALLSLQGEPIKTLWSGEGTDIVAQLKLSPKGDKLLAVVYRLNEGWNIEEFDIEKQQWEFITKDRAVDMYPSYSDEGKSILFSSERSGRYQVYRYQHGQETLQQLTRVKSGAFYPVQATSDSPLYYIGYHAKGYDVYRMTSANVLEEITVEASSKITPELASTVMISEESDYQALSTMQPRWWFPFFSFSEDRDEFGVATSGNDALGIHNYFMSLAYDASNEWFVGNVNYAYANNFAIGYQRSTDIFRDRNGDFALARNVDDVFTSFALNLPSVNYRLSYIFGAVVSESSDGRRAENILPLADDRDNLVGVAALFNNSENYIRSISPADGRSLRFVAETTELLDSDFTGEIYTLDWREFINLGQQHVLALRFVQGWGTESPKPFRLGGEDNDYNALDFIFPVSESIFADRKYSLRGYPEGLAALSGRRMQLASLEWRFPGQLIERGWMSPPLGLLQWSGSVFAETGAAYESSSPDEYYSSVGIEFQADINLFYLLNSRMRIGLASGLDDELGDNRAYFILGSSF